jgi:hypothetical protein
MHVKKIQSYFTIYHKVTAWHCIYVTAIQYDMTASMPVTVPTDFTPVKQLVELYMMSHGDDQELKIFLYCVEY